MEKREHAIKVLIVDDQPDLLGVLKDILVAQNFKVSTSSSAEQALQSIKSEPFDLLISDIGLPGMNGWQLVEISLRYQEKLEAIMISSWKDDQTESHLRRTGASAIIHKPFRVNALLEAIDNLGLTPRNETDNNSKIG